MTLEEHAPEVLSHLVGNLLGDAYAKHGSLTTSIQIAGSEKHSVYIGYLHEFYSSRGYCSNKPLAKSSHTLLNGKTYLTFRFYTYAFQSFNLLHEMFYRPANEAEKLCGRVFIKIVPKNIVQFLTPQALAVWIMDDGGFYKKKQILTISTDGFVQEDLELLKLLKSISTKLWPYF